MGLPGGGEWVCGFLGACTIVQYEAYQKLSEKPSPRKSNPTWRYDLGPERCFLASLIYVGVSWMTIFLPLSAGLNTMSGLEIKTDRASCSSVDKLWCFSFWMGEV